ncbi:13190_t:CDS:2 [Ambispora gerdemannii]|uniref:13190_t:CDS:1 n=1 Tax=Ambispora gerdemannii TaxID=144530 RepID=A0A9N9CRS2_9GLOM|nr:13190_t:CDS:2 [Ambispora gerdemannii]
MKNIKVILRVIVAVSFLINAVENADTSKNLSSATISLSPTLSIIQTQTTPTNSQQQQQQQTPSTNSDVVNDNDNTATTTTPDITVEPSSSSTDEPQPTSTDDAVYEDHTKIIIKLNNYLSIASIVGGLIVLLVIASMWHYDRKLVNRVSLRLTAVISFVDILNAISIILYTDITPADTPLCTGISAAMSFLPQVYLFLTVMIAFNLQLVFLHRRKISKFSDRWYIPVAILAALALNVPPLVLGRFGYDEHSEDCYYRDSTSKETFYWQLFAFIIPILFAMVYCTAVLIIVVFKIVFENRKLAETIQTGSTTMSIKAKQQKLLVLRLVSRISLYACIPVLSVAGIIAMYIWAHLTSADIPFGVILWSVIGSCIPAFLFDPAVHNAFNKMRRELVQKYGFDMDQIGSMSKSTFSPPPSPLAPITPMSPSFRMSLSPSSPGSASHLMPPTSPMTRSSSLRPMQKDFGTSSSLDNHQQQQQQEGDNRFMIWFVRKFLAPKQRAINPMTTTTSSLPSFTHSYNYKRPQRGGHRHTITSNSKISTLGRVDEDSNSIGVAISTPGNTISTATSSYATYDSRSRLTTNNSNGDMTAFQYARENSIYSQYYCPSDDVEAMGSSRPSSSLVDESEWGEYEMTVL